MINKRFSILSAILISISALSVRSVSAQVNYPGGRIAISADGNQHDKDDWGATALSLALIDAAGLNDRLVHCDYSNHMGDSNPTWELRMIESAEGGAERFNMNRSVFFNDQEDPEGAVVNLAAAINASSSDDPLWIIAAGPMEMVWRGINAAIPEKRAFVTVISHSRWNQNHGDTPQMTHDWADLKRDFSPDGVFFVESSVEDVSDAVLGDPSKLPDQNQSSGDLDFNTPEEKWYWLRDSEIPDWRWLYALDDKNGFDVSDAGMTYFLITGGPHNGGCKNCGVEQVRELLHNPVPKNILFEEDRKDTLIYPLSMDSIHINDLIVHDPCILPDRVRGKYYIYSQFSPEKFRGVVDAPDGKAGVFWQSSLDLVYWSRPEPAFVIPDDFWADDDSGPWAPEVHVYKGKYYMFVTFNAWDEIMDVREGRPRINRRASQILVSDSPEGPFVPFHNRSSTPDGEMTLDATLWVEDGQPWLVYCHEWVQLGDGLIKAIRLGEDLSETIGKPVILLNAGEAGWTRKEINYRGTRYPGAVTDGPYFYRTREGNLLMVWSSWTPERQYATAVAVSETGSITGPWNYDREPILQDDRGHAMIFEDFQGRLLLSLHRYFHYPETRVQIWELEDTGDNIRVKGQVLGAQ